MKDRDETFYLQELQVGSVKAFDVLYNKYSGKLYNFVMFLSGKDIYLSEEIVQQVFIKIWETHELIDTRKSFNAYLFTIARNLLMNSYQHQLVESVYQEYVRREFTEIHSETEQAIEYHLLDEMVDTIVSQLPEGRKKVYLLSKKEHLQNKEIAKKLGISESTVEKQLSMAMQFLRKRLMQHYDTLFLLYFFIYM
jgi:RNA polymerase sigma-70 factor (ECF subfamily)